MKIYSLLYPVAMLVNLAYGQTQEINQSRYETDTTKVNDLEEVILTATRTERQLSSLPLPAQIIKEEEIDRINSMRLQHLLNEQTGLITVPDFGGGEGIQIQGMDSQYTLVLIDGVPLIGRSAGTLDISRITVGNIKQIEVVKGASSSLYGSEAMGGVVNIITHTPEEGFTAVAGHRYSSYNTNDTNMEVGVGKDRYGLSFYANRYSSDGYDLSPNTDLRTVDPFENYTVGLKFKYQFSDNTKVNISSRFYDQKQDFTASEELRGSGEIKEWNLTAKLDHHFNDRWGGTFEFYSTRYRTEETLIEIDDSLNDFSYFDQLMIRPEFRAIYSMEEKGTIITGAGYTRETLERTDFSETPRFDAYYLFAQYDRTYFDHLNVILGARLDHHSEYKTQFSPKLALRYEISDKLDVKGSVGYGFKAPDFRQLYFDFSNSTVGYTILGYNAVPTRLPQMIEQGQILEVIVPVEEFESPLKPENSIGINIGTGYKPMTGLSLELNLFNNHINDLIDTRVIASKTNGQNVFSYYNIHQVVTRGLELNASYKPVNQLTFSAGYQLLYAKDKEAVQEFKDGNVYARDPETQITFQLAESDYFGLYNRSRHMFNFKVFYDHEPWRINTNIRFIYRSKFGLYDTNGNNYLDKYDEFVDGYGIVNWAMNKSIGKYLVMGFGIDNIFDYTDPQNLSNIPGRIIYGNLKIKL